MVGWSDARAAAVHLQGRALDVLNSEGMAGFENLIGQLIPGGRGDGPFEAPGAPVAGQPETAALQPADVCLT